MPFHEIRDSMVGDIGDMDRDMGIVMEMLVNGVLENTRHKNTCSQCE